ncbi:methyltransferase [Hirsutella rhossiliensis]|uniref:Methyltransferase domain-containing protein n=1 Tax=Hirsutella rhossiliensis TaxID=111463 RepID=A0A9P8MT99_9HYPO|nr:methyltransferase domain-containing protein [Hirsutella rhossiliensis]KAH0961022.1 methyltransferase domain-containing protein [Hirsutella rhossiliensis]
MPHQPSLADAAANLSELFQRAGQKTTTSEQDLVMVSRQMLRLLAAPLLEQMGLPQTTSSVALLDNACGTGVVTQEVQSALAVEVLRRSRFMCADSSEAMIGLVRKRAAAEGWVNVEARVADARDSGLPADSFSHVAVALGLHIIPDPDAVIEDCRRMLRPGGIFGATTFPQRNGQMFWYPDMRSAFASLPFPTPPLPDTMPMQMHSSGRWDDAAWVEQHLRKRHGLAGVTVRTVGGRWRVEDAGEFVAAFGVMLPWLMATWWDEETRMEHPVDKVRELVRRHLAEKHGGGGWEVEWEVLSMTGVEP